MEGMKVALRCDAMLGRGGLGYRFLRGEDSESGR